MSDKEAIVYEGESAVRFLSGEFYGGAANVVCPNCRSDYTHVDSVGTLVGSDEYEAGIYPGTVPVGTTGSRRSAVEIVFSCEMCDQLFAVVIQQHKGVNLIEVRSNVPARSIAE